jgi:AbrB family looped-hinge helix DNA binding protein
MYHGRLRRTLERPTAWKVFLLIVILSYMKVYKVTEKGQVTIPLEVSETLGMDQDSLLEVWTKDGEVRMRKVEVGQVVGPRDPIRELIGIGDSGRHDVSDRHDDYIAEGEIRRWRASSSTRARSTRFSTGATGTTGRRPRSSKH